MKNKIALKLRSHKITDSKKVEDSEDLFCVTLKNMSKEDAKLYGRTYGLKIRPRSKGFDLAGDEDSVREMLEDYIGRYDEIGKIMNDGWYVPDWQQEEFTRVIDSKKSKTKDSDAWHEKAHYELTFEDGHKERDTIPMYVKMGYTDEDILDYFQGYYDDKIVSVKQVGWSRMGDAKKVKDYRLRTIKTIKEAKDHIVAYIDMFLNNDDELTEKYEKKFKAIKKDSNALNNLGKKVLKFTKDNPEWQDEDLNEEIYKMLKSEAKNIKDAKKIEDSEEVSDDNREALEEYLEWEGIIGYTNDIIDVYEDEGAYIDEEWQDFDDAYDALDAYLEWEGIYGYTDAIYDILECGRDSSYYEDMVEERDN